jgi:predicted RNase H-like nuclease
VNQTNKDLTGKGLTQQSANLADGIYAVDQLLQEKEACDRLVEGHPEVCFQAFADEPLRHSKKTAPGVNERLTALESTDEYEKGDWRTIAQHLGDEDYPAGLDDVLDATALAVTACATEGEDLQKLPQHPREDSKGRPMQIIYRRREPFDEGQ